MAEEEPAIDPFIENLYRETPFTKISKMIADKIYKRWVRRAIEEGVSEPVTKVQTAFFSVDKDVTSSELEEELEKPEYIGVPYESMEEEAYGLTLGELDRLIEEAKSVAKDLGKRIVVAKEEEIKELERERAKALKRQRQLEKVLKVKEEELETMTRKHERLESEYKREVERLKLAKIVTVRFKADIPKFIGSDLATYGPFRKGEIVGLPEPNAAVLIEKGLAEPWVMAPPPVPKVKPKVKPLEEEVEEAIKELRKLL